MHITLSGSAIFVTKKSLYDWLASTSRNRYACETVAQVNRSVCICRSWSVVLTTGA